MKKEYEKLINASNEYHEAIYDCLDSKELDILVKREMETKIQSLRMIAKRYGVELEV